MGYPFSEQCVGDHGCSHVTNADLDLSDVLLFRDVVLKIRTFLEHRAHQYSTARTVIIDDKGPLAFLFLNNNLHAVHHLHPQVAWYNLPRLYRDNAASYDGFNEDYNYRSYAQVIARYFVKAKDPVPHPLWPSE